MSYDSQLDMNLSPFGKGSLKLQKKNDRSSDLRANELVFAELR